jgi:hypothetical protein
MKDTADFVAGIRKNFKRLGLSVQNCTELDDDLPIELFMSHTRFVKSMLGFRSDHTCVAYLNPQDGQESVLPKGINEFSDVMYKESRSRCKVWLPRMCGLAFVQIPILIVDEASKHLIAHVKKPAPARSGIFNFPVLVSAKTGRCFYQKEAQLRGMPFYEDYIPFAREVIAPLAQKCFAHEEEEVKENQG